MKEKRPNVPCPERNRTKKELIPVQEFFKRAIRQCFQEFLGLSVTQ